MPAFRRGPQRAQSLTLGATPRSIPNGLLPWPASGAASGGAWGRATFAQTSPSGGGSGNAVGMDASAGAGSDRGRNVVVVTDRDTGAATGVGGGAAGEGARVGRVSAWGASAWGASVWGVSAWGGAASAATICAEVFSAGLDSSRLAIEPVMSSRLRSSVTIRASSRSRSAASTRTVSDSRRPSASSGGGNDLDRRLGVGARTGKRQRHPVHPGFARDRKHREHQRGDCAQAPGAEPQQVPHAERPLRRLSGAAGWPSAMLASLRSCLDPNHLVENISRFAAMPPQSGCLRCSEAFFLKSARL